MDVQHATREPVHRRRSEDAHVAGQCHEVRRKFAEQLVERCVELAAGGESAELDDPGRDAGLPGALQPEGRGVVADHRCDVCIDLAGRYPVHDGLQICAAAGYQHDDAQLA